MRILIVGAGIVGSNLARELSSEGHDISLIEADPAIVKRLSDKLDVLLINGDGTSQKILKEAGIREVEMIIAVTSSDEANILVCSIARGFHIPRKIARVRNPEYTAADSVINIGELGVDLLVNPDETIVNSLVKMIETPGATDVAEFAGGKILLRGFKVPRGSPICNKKLSELKEASSLDSFLIAAVSRNGRLTIPRGNDLISADDTIFVLVAEETLPLFLPFVNRSIDEVGSVVIFGASIVGCKLAEALEQKLDRVTLIEPDEERAEAAATQLAKTEVVNGEATDKGVLEGANIHEASFFIAATVDDEANLLASLLARECGAKRTIVVTQNPDYISVLESIGIDVVLNQGLVTTSKILQFIRKGKIMSVVKLHESEAEIIELEVDSKSCLVGKRLRDVNYPEGAIVGAVMRENAMIIPNGDTEIKAGDGAVVLARPEAIPAVEKLFAKKKLFG